MTAAHVVALSTVVFWVGVLFGAVAEQEEGALMVPTLLTIGVVLGFVLRGL